MHERDFLMYETYWYAKPGRNRAAKYFPHTAGPVHTLLNLFCGMGRNLKLKFPIEMLKTF
jgi:hypothetical protein